MLLLLCFVLFVCCFGVLGIVLQVVVVVTVVRCVCFGVLMIAVHAVVVFVCRFWLHVVVF